MTAQTTQTTSPEGPTQAGTRRLYRSRSNRVFAGVCAGVAEYYGSDPTAVRLATLILGLFTGIVPMVLIYVIAAIVVPENGATDPVVGRASAAPGQAALVFGGLLILIGLASFANVWLRLDWDYLWPVALIGLGVVIVVASARR
jgi:phage shock protein C